MPGGILGALSSSSASASANLRGWCASPGASSKFYARGPTPERCLEAYHFHRTRLKLIAERKVRRRQLTDDGNVEITGRDLREGSVQARHSRPIGYDRAAS